MVDRHDVQTDRRRLAHINRLVELDGDAFAVGWHTKIGLWSLTNALAAIDWHIKIDLMILATNVVMHVERSTFAMSKLAAIDRHFLIDLRNLTTSLKRHSERLVLTVSKLNGVVWRH